MRPGDGTVGHPKRPVEREPRGTDEEGFVAGNRNVVRNDIPARQLMRPGTGAVCNPQATGAVAVRAREKGPCCRSG